MNDIVQLISLAVLICAAFGVIMLKTSVQRIACSVVGFVAILFLFWFGFAERVFTNLDLLISGSGGAEGMLFWVFAVLSCGGAVAVVLTQNVVRMAFWLVVSLGSVAALFFLLHADFLGAAQLLIYVGGTVVLLVFGVMLTASGPTVQIKTSAGDSLVGAAVGCLLLLVMIFTIRSVEWDGIESRLPSTPLSASTTDEQKLANLTSDVETSSATNERSAAKANLASTVARQQQGRTVRQLGLGFLGLRPDRDLNASGNEGLSPGYLLPFEIVSIHLLVVLVGAAYLARAKRRSVVETPVEY